MALLETEGAIDDSNFKDEEKEKAGVERVEGVEVEDVVTENEEEAGLDIEGENENELKLVVCEGGRSNPDLDRELPSLPLAVVSRSSSVSSPEPSSSSSSSSSSPSSSPSSSSSSSS